MYFSTNSRCVLRKARFLSPVYLNKFGQNLSVKKPKDDPTKPPLRINIPDDDRDNLLRKRGGATEVKTSGTVFRANYQDDIFRKSDEIPFSKVDDFFVNNSVEESSKEGNFPTSDCINYTFNAIDSEKLDSKANASDAVSFDNINNSNIIFEGSESAEKLEEKEAFEKPAPEKTWYILVDVHPEDERTGIPKQQKSLQTRPKTPKIKKSKSLIPKSKHLSKFSSQKPNRFEVHEHEDEATYVLYVKLNRQLQKKPCDLGCVPEKEFTIRIKSNHEQQEINDFQLEKRSDRGKKRHKIRKKEQPATVADKNLQEQEAIVETNWSKENSDSKQDVFLNVEQKENLVNDFGVAKTTYGKSRDAEVSPNTEVPSTEAQKAYADYSLADRTAEMPKAEASAAATNLKVNSTPFPTETTRQLYVALGENIQAHASEAKAKGKKTPENAIHCNRAHYNTQNQPASPRESEARATKPLSSKQQEEQDADEKKYLSIYDESNEKSDKKGNAKNLSNLWKASQQEKPPVENSNNDVPDFQTVGNFVTIGRTETSTYSMTFGAAFPPLLKEALKTLRLKENFNEKWKNLSKGGDHKSEQNKMLEFSENSIFFPKSESEGFDCESLFTTKEQIILNVIKDGEESCAKSSSEVSKNVESSVDSLSVMKKVKEMVQLDLDNAVKIFDDGRGENGKELSSVVVSTTDGWKVDRKDLESQMAIRRKEMKLNSAILGRNILGYENNAYSSKYLPSRKGSELEIQLPDKQINSVVMFNPKSNEFFICKEALAESISRKTNDTLEEINETLNVLAKRSKSAKDLKSGDSILVFDDETQSWKVDFSILEKRQQQLQLEEELTKRSELILETFEELEKNQTTFVPRPDSKEKKTFDYAKKEWKDLKNPNEKSTKPKYPFKDTNAEEIRKKNSDLYENLFVTKKKEMNMKNPEKKAPGASSTSPKKESKSADSGEKKEASAEADGAGKSGPTSKNPDGPKSNFKLPPAENKNKNEEDNFWETFLKMNILPKDISEIPKNPPKPIKEPEPIKPEIKPETPAFKIQVPFQRRTPKETEGELHRDKQKKITPPPPPRSEKPAVKAPPPSNQISKEDPKKTDLPKFDISKPSPKPDPSKQRPKADSSKVDPPKPPPKLEPSKQPPKSDPPKLDPPKPPPKLEPSKQPPKADSSKLDLPKPPPKLEPSKPPPKSDPPKLDPTPKPPTAPPKTDPPKTTPVSGPPKLDPPKLDPPKLDPTPKPPTSDPPAAPPKTDPPKPPPKLDPPKPTPISDPPKLSPPKQPPKEDPRKSAPSKLKDIQKTPKDGKSASPPADRYVSDKIIEISRSKGKDQFKKKTKVETVKLNITSDTRLPSKITEINLGKKLDKEETSKEAQKKPIGDKTSSGDIVKISEESQKEKKPLHKDFEKYRTSFSDPEYEEKPMKIKSDIESNPNLKKLDNWNKTLVLHDIMKPPENIETWLKDETDKMATLLLKILQEASDGKPKKRQLPFKTKPGEIQGRANPYENIRKKQENTPEGFLFKIRTVNFSLENPTKKPSEDKKLNKLKGENEISVKTAKPTKNLDKRKLPVEKDAIPMAAVTSGMKTFHLPANLEERRERTVPWMAGSSGDFVPLSKEPSQDAKLIVDVTEEIPGPEILKKISNAWKLLPVLDSQITVFTLFRVFQLVNLGGSFLNPSNTNKAGRNAFSKLFSKFGPIVNVKGPFSGNVVLIHKPEHLAVIFDQDPSIFVRSVFDSVEQIRKDSDEKSVFGVSVDWTSPEWTDLKRVTNDTSTRGCERHLASAEIAVNSLIGIIRKNRNSQDLVSEDFMEEIKRWSLEGLCNVLFEKSFGFMEGRIPNTNWILEPDKMYTAFERASQCLNKCERGFQMWRLMRTPSAMNLTEAYRAMSAIIIKQTYQAGMNLKTKNELLKNGSVFHSRDLTLIESMLLNDGMASEDIICNLVDILLIGTNTINSTVGFLLYNLALNIRAQSKLFQELKEVLPSKYSPLDHNKLVSLKYLQACIKESLRLYMPIPIFCRLLQNDILLANYFIPKGTYIVMDQRISNQKEYIFEDPEKFSPERWLTEEKWMQDYESFTLFPLCHGPRAEFAKKVMELQLFTFVAKIFRNFQVEYHYGEIHSTNSLINVLDKPLKLNFIERES